MEQAKSASRDTGHLEKTGPMGRVGRVVLGLFLTWYLIRFVGAWISAIQQGNVAPHQDVYTAVVQRGNLLLYAIALFALIFPRLVILRARVMVSGVLFIIVVLADYLLFGDWWGLPLAAFLSLLIVGFLGFFAISLVLAGVLAYPGCEETAIPNLLSRREQLKVHT